MAFIWTEQMIALLGTKSDYNIGKDLGVKPHIVAKKREELNIPVHKDLKDVHNALNMNEFGNVVRDIRGDIPIKDLAEEINVHRNTLQRVENGEVPDLVTFAKICKFMKLDANYFLGNEITSIPRYKRLVSRSNLTGDKYKFPVWTTIQGGGLVRLIPETHQHIFIEEPRSSTGFTVGDFVPKGWVLSPANELAIIENSKEFRESLYKTNESLGRAFDNRANGSDWIGEWIRSNFPNKHPKILTGNISVLSVSIEEVKGIQLEDPAFAFEDFE